MTEQEMSLRLDWQLQEVQRQQAALVNWQRPKREWPAEPWDTTNISTEQSEKVARFVFLEKRRQQCIRAKARFDEGLAGVCEICGRRINRDRLKVMVEATCCVQCLQHTQQKLAGNIRRGSHHYN